MTVMTSQIWPPVEPRTLTRQVWDSTTARGLPGVAMALHIYSLIAACPLQLVRGTTVLDTPRLLDRPDPDEARSTFVGSHLEDWWLNGNAASLVTARFKGGSFGGYPAAARWYPSHRWTIEDRNGQPTYRLDGLEVARDDVVHVKRGQDPRFPLRGMGVVEQHLRTLNRAGLEEAAESASLTDRNTPNVAVITNKADPLEADLDAAADKWVAKFGGTEPKPAMLPSGTQIVPLSWNPSDGQMVEARKMSVNDVANIFGLDGYWLGAEASSHNYKSPGPLFTLLTKVSLGPVMEVFEDVWSNAWYAGRGTRARFDRWALLADDFASMVAAFNVGSRLFPDPNEPRRLMGFPELPDDAFPTVPTPPAPADQPTDTPPADDSTDPEEGA